MFPVLSYLHLAFLGIGCALIAGCAEAPPAPPDGRDRQVLEAALLHLLTDGDFRGGFKSLGEDALVLHVQTPQSVGHLAHAQLQADLGNHHLPPEVEEALRRRNTAPDAPPDSYQAVPAFYNQFKFARGILVADLSDKWEFDQFESAFEDLHPQPRGWACAHLPGYCQDGRLAVVRTYFGPSLHGAVATVLLEHRGGQWVVKWHRMAWYA